MKSLDQLDAKLEKRTPISSLPFTIAVSGSYYLTGSLRFTAASGNAITITVSDVTLNLNGFTLSSTAAVTGDAISINPSLRNIAVINGAIAGNTTVTIGGTVPNETWTIAAAGFNTGVGALGPQAVNCQFNHLRISGCRVFGLDASASVVEHMSVTQNGSGISATSDSVINSVANLNGNNGISANSGSVFHCIARSNGNHGISAESASVTNTTASHNGNVGIFCRLGVIAFCMATDNYRRLGGGVDLGATGSTRTGNNPTP